MAAADKTEPITSAIAPDLGVVRRFITDMLARGAIVELVAAIVGLLGRMRDLNTELVAKLAGKSRKRPPNESLRRLQLELPLFMTPAANDAEPTKPLERMKKKRGAKKPRAHGRPKLPAHLPRVPDIHRVPDVLRACPNCDVEAKTIGYRIVEKLDIEPAKFIVRQEKYETVACQKCHTYVCTCPKKDEVLDRGILGNDLLVEALVDHYDDAVPWERMARRAREQGVPLAANTLASSVGRVIDLFEPIVDHIKQKCLASSFTALDATGMRVLDSEHPLGVRTAALWLILGGHQYAYYAYAPTGHDDHLEELLEGCSLGSVMCDGSPTNNPVERAGGARGGCHAHARRRLVEALRQGDTRAASGIELYANIFHVDAESKRLGESIVQRFERRRKDSAPLVAELRAWADARRADVEPKSALGGALGYIHRQWKRLTAFLRDPLMELTNNEVERDLRRWILDRKTWLFVGHEKSARRAAAALSLLTTCRKMGIEPRRYLKETLAKILSGEKDLTALLPETYQGKTAEQNGISRPAAA